MSKPVAQPPRPRSRFHPRGRVLDIRTRDSYNYLRIKFYGSRCGSTLPSDSQDLGWSPGRCRPQDQPWSKARRATREPAEARGRASRGRHPAGHVGDRLSPRRDGVSRGATRPRGGVDDRLPRGALLPYRTIIFTWSRKRTTARRCRAACEGSRSALREPSTGRSAAAVAFGTSVIMRDRLRRHARFGTRCPMS